MPNTAAGTMAFLNGSEIINNARTVDYIRNGYGPSTLRVENDCGCPQSRELANCDGASSTLPYTSPATDPAPWYSPTIPESIDFAGLFVTEFTGLGSPFFRSVTSTITGGGVLGRLRAKERTLVWRGFLVGRTCCGVSYGLRWLTQQLAGSAASGCGDCSTEDLDLLICCPDTPGPTPCDIGPDILSIPNDDAFRTLKAVGLIVGPNIISERPTGCSCGASCITEIEFSLVAGQPYLYRQPVTIGDCVLFPPAPVTCVEFIKVPPGTLADCGDATCPDPASCTHDPRCPEPSLPVATDEIENCACDPFDPVQTCFSIPTSAFGNFFEGVPIITISSGSSALHGVTVRFFENPANLSCDVVAADPCGQCDELQVRFIPAFSTLTIDGTTKKITILCPGGIEEPGEKYTTSPFSWPVLKCIGTCICIEVDSATAASDACATVVVVPREA